MGLQQRSPRWLKVSEERPQHRAKGALARPESVELESRLSTTTKKHLRAGSVASPRRWQAHLVQRVFQMKGRGSPSLLTYLSVPSPQGLFDDLMASD